MSVKENIKKIMTIIDAAKERSAVKGDVTLIAVSKTHGPELIMEAYDEGIRDFGENKVQEFLSKYDDLPDDINWHFIGHLQTNKVKQIVGKVKLIHSVDSLHLAEKIDQESKKAGLVSDILVEVNMAEEQSKFGINASEAADIMRSLSMLSGIRVMGLMTVAPYTEDPEENRVFFARMRKLSIDIQALNLDNINMYFLSMGMSGDYPVAIEEGANLVRIGTSIFGEREYLSF